MNEPDKLISLPLLGDLLAIHDAKVVGAAIQIFNAGGSRVGADDMKTAIGSAYLWQRHEPAIRHVLWQLEERALPVRDLGVGDLAPVT